MPYQKVISEILRSAKILTADKTSVVKAFRSANVEVNNDLELISFLEPPESCLTALMINLQSLPAVKVSAQMILQKRGIRY